MAERRHEEGTLEHRVCSELRRMITVRSSLPSLDGSAESEIADPVNPGVLVFLRRAATQTMVGIYDVTPDLQGLPRWAAPLGDGAWDALGDQAPLTDEELWLQPYQARWLVEQV